MFKSDIIDMGTIAPGSTVRIEWEIIDNPEQVIHWQPDCGCTANIRKEGNKLVAEFTEEDHKNLTPEQLTNWYPSGAVPITKGITVYLRSEHDLWTIENGVQSINPLVPTKKVTFIGYAATGATTANPPQLTLG